MKFAGIICAVEFRPNVVIAIGARGGVRVKLYKGYLPTNGKVPKIKFKGKTEDLLSFEQVKDLPEYAAILSDDVIVIDIDDGEQAEILMNIIEDLQIDCVVRQTSRGKHFLFKNSGVENCAQGRKLACGLTADIKIGSKNSTQQLKINGEERFIEWDCEEPEPLPKWLFPIKTDVDFFEMKEGEGRNSKLFGYILTLTNAGFSQEESRECLRIINKFILHDALSEDELKTIMRDEAFPAETFFNGKSFLHNNFALFVQNNDHVKRINGQLHVYRDGVYVPGTREIEGLMLKHLPTLRSTHRTEVLKYLDITCPSVSDASDANLIAFKNGLFDIATGEMKNFSPDVVITNKIPWEYDPEAYSEIGDKTLNKLACNDPAIRALLEECIGYCFYRRNELSKAFVLTGDKSNGKSTFLDMVKNVLGEQNYSALDLAELDERFSVATMAGKLANIGDDISDDFLQGRSVANFKKLVSGNQVKAEIKNDPNIFFMKPSVKLLFSANDIPRMKDKTGAVLRRLVIIPFNARFSKEDPDFDPYITWKLKDEAVMKYLVRIGVEGLKRVIENRGFTTSRKLEKELKDYEIQNNPILLFLQEKPFEEIVNNPTKDVHFAYRLFCSENGFSEMTLSTFSKEICKRLDLTVARRRINGKLVGIYVKG